MTVRVKSTELTLDDPVFSIRGSKGERPVRRVAVTLGALRAGGDVKTELRGSIELRDENRSCSRRESIGRRDYPR